MATINLPYGNNTFEVEELIEYLKSKSCNYIIQGQQACVRSKHTKPNSLDCWLRDNVAQNPDTKQAVNELVEALVGTGKFKAGDFICPDSGKICKGVKLV